MDGRRICSQPERNEIRSVLSVTFPLFLPSVLFEARDTGLGNRYTRLVCLLSPAPPTFFRIPSPPLSPDSTFGRTVASHLLCFPDCFSRTGILFRKNTRESFESVVVQPPLHCSESRRARLRSPRLRLKGPLPPLRPSVISCICYFSFGAISPYPFVRRMRTFEDWLMVITSRDKIREAGNIFIFSAVSPIRFPVARVRTAGSKVSLSL